MNNDLISREALKKAFNKWWGCDDIPATVVEDIIDNAPTVKAFTEEDVAGAYNEGYACGGRENTRPQGELKEYKPLELDYNVKSAVENLKTAYWSDDTEKYAKAFTEAEEIIINAICHYGYIVMKGGADND